MTHALARLDGWPNETHLAAQPGDPLAGRTRAALILTGALAACAAAAITFVPVDGAVVGTGQIDAESQVKTIAHPAGGTVAAILVRNGDHVRKGQPLLRLDDRVTASDARLASLSVAQLRARKARLEAEAAGSPAIAFPPDLLASTDPATRSAIADERGQLTASRAQEASLTGQSAAQAEEYRQQITGYQAQIQALRQQSALIRPERDAMASLYARKLVTVSRYNQIERTAADLQGSIATLVSQIAATRARIAEARSQIAQTQATRRADAGDKLAQVNDLLGQQQARSVTATDIQDRAVIRAPYDGVVDKMALATIGGVIRPAEPLLSIVPDRDRPIVTATVRPDEIDQVAVGQSVRVRVSAFGAATAPELKGRITYVGANRATDPDSHQSFYDVRVAIDPASLHTSSVALRTGMPVEIFITSGSRSILSYLMKPLADQFARAFRDH